MVTNVTEGKIKKCEQYWPEDASVSSFGPFDVSVVEQHIFADYVIRHIQLVVSLFSILIHKLSGYKTKLFFTFIKKINNNIYKYSILVKVVSLVK